MLGKLIKHDFIGSAHSMSIVYLIAGIIAAVTALSYAFDLTILKTLSTLALVIVVIGLVLITVFFMMSYYNKSLYTDRGYLTFTLPVKANNILFSKILVSFVWILLSYMILIGSMFLLLWYAKAKLGEELGYEIDQLIDSFSMLMSGSGLPKTVVIIKIAVYAVIFGFITIMIIVAESFFAITLSNVKGFNKLGFFGGILIFAVIYVAMKLASSAITVYAPVSLYLNETGVGLCFKSMDSVAGTVGIGGVIFEAVMAVVMIIGTRYLMTNKINLR